MPSSRLLLTPPTPLWTKKLTPTTTFWSKQHTVPIFTVSVYPPLALQTQSPPADRPQPYVGNNNLDTLEFFREDTSAQEWTLYRLWIQQYQETSRKPIEDLVIRNGITITNEQAYSLQPGEWINDAVLHFVFKSMESILGFTDVSVVFFPSFFFNKLLQQDWRALPTTYDFAGVSTWNKRLFEGKSIGDVKTIVFLQNLRRGHWKCFVVFMDLKIIQSFDSLRGGDQYLHCLYIVGCTIRWWQKARLLMKRNGVCTPPVEIPQANETVIIVVCSQLCLVCVLPNASR